ncbi:hypothetical protein P7C73_g907, partial [Tremellales sp. Uapishka_1]
MSKDTLVQLAGDLVLLLVPALEDDAENLAIARGFVVKELAADNHGGSRREWEDVQRTIDGMVKTARIRTQPDLADALDLMWGFLQDHKAKGGKGWQGDMPVQVRILPLELNQTMWTDVQSPDVESAATYTAAEKPTSQTHDFSHDLLHRTAPTGPTSDQILYREIMAEVWEGDDVGPEEDEEEVMEGWTESEESEEDEQVLTPSSKVSVKQSYALRRREAEHQLREREEIRMQEAEEILAKIGNDAYWKVGGKTVGRPRGGLYGWRDLSTATTASALDVLIDPESKMDTKVISAQQLQRELLFALSGRPGILMTFSEEGECSIIEGHPGVVQYTSTGLQGILRSIKERASQAASLRHFVTHLLQPGPRSSETSRKSGATPSKTVQAYAGACRCFLEEFDLWIAELEASFILGEKKASSSRMAAGSPAAATPLLLKSELEARYGTLLGHLSSILKYSDTPILLLNVIYSTIETLRHTAPSDSSLRPLSAIFVSSARPIWNMLGDWLRRGMPIPESLQSRNTDIVISEEERTLDPEFFIKRDLDISFGDEDFWESGFVENSQGWPLWLDHGVRDQILEAGKAKGLLRSLLDKVGEAEDWRGLDKVISPEDDTDISQSISEYLGPICQIAQTQLRRVLEEECGLVEHLEAIEGLYFMRGYRVVDDWSDWLFDQIHCRKKWRDLQILTSSMRDTIEKHGDYWMNASAIRIRAVGRAENSIGPRILSALRVNYLVPFPLSQLFSSTSIELRSEVFVFLLQIQRARKLLIDTKELDSGFVAARRANDEMKALWRLKQRLSWLINTLWIWITERVIDLQIRVFRSRLATLSSLHAMIALELEHSRGIRDFCFLHADTSPLYETVLSILDASSTLSRYYTSYVNDGSQTASTSMFVQGRSKRRQRRRIHESSDDESDSEQQPSGVLEEEEGRFSFPRLNKLEVGLEGDIKTLKEGLETLCLSSDSENSSVWGMLSFALEDWKVE